MPCRLSSPKPTVNRPSARTRATLMHSTQFSLVFLVCELAEALFSKAYCLYWSNFSGARDNMCSFFLGGYADLAMRDEPNLTHLMQVLCRTFGSSDVMLSTRSQSQHLRCFLCVFGVLSCWSFHTLHGVPTEWNSRRNFSVLYHFCQDNDMRNS